MKEFLKMLNNILVVTCPKCNKYYTQQQLKASFVNGQSITFQCLESNGEGCKSILQADFYMEPTYVKKFKLLKFGKVDEKIGEKLSVKVIAR